MSDEACTLPAREGDDEYAIIQRLLKAQRIAVVGLSNNPSRASNMVARYLMSVGKEVIPVNPSHRKVMDLHSYTELEQVPGKIDLVNVFRRAEFCPAVVESAIKAHAGGVWLQSGIVSPESRRLSDAAGMDYVEDRCLMVEHMHGGAVAG
jgi:predicted CoA-binding protein